MKLQRLYDYRPAVQAALRRQSAVSANAITNFTPQTAFEIPSLPYMNIQDIGPAPTNGTWIASCGGGSGFNATWYTYVTKPTERVLAVVANGSFPILTSVWQGTLPGITERSVSGIAFCEQSNGGFYMEVPVQPSTRYWFQVNSKAGVASPAVATFTLLPPLAGTMPAGTLFIPDDTAGFPAAAVSPTSKEITLTPVFPAGSSGAVLVTGEVCVQNDLLTSLAFYDVNQIQVATASLGAENLQVRGISSNRVSKFFVVTTSAKLRRFSKLGVLEQTWNLPFQPVRHCVSRDGNTLYYTVVADETVVSVYDLVNQVGLPDVIFVSGDVQEIVVTGDTNIWVTYNDGGDIFLEGYKTDGDFVNGWFIETVTVGGRMCLDETDQNVWVWLTADGFHRLGPLGVLLNEIDFIPSANFAQATVSGHPAVANEPWYLSDGCPLLVLSALAVSTVLVSCPTNSGQVGFAYSSAFTAIGGLGPFTYSIPFGVLPNGLTLNSSSGAVTGTPIAYGTFAFTAKVVDSLGQSATADCAINVIPAPGGCPA